MTELRDLLADLRVVEFAASPATGYCAKLFAEAGASVTRLDTGQQGIKRIGRPRPAQLRREAAVAQLPRNPRQGFQMLGPRARRPRFPFRGASVSTSAGTAPSAGICTT